MKHNESKELHRIAVRVAVIEQKCDLILAQLSTLRTKGSIDDLIDRLHWQARSMRKEARRPRR